MNDFDTALHMLDNVAPEEVFKALFENADESGRISWVDPAEPDFIEHIAMDWSYSACERTAQEFARIYEQIKTLGAQREELLSHPENAEMMLDSKLYDAWETFARPFKVEDPRLWELFEREGFEDSLSAEEQALLDSYYEARAADAVERVGESDFADSLCIRGVRLCKLISLGAPQEIVDNEAKMFASFLAFHKYGRYLGAMPREAYDLDQRLDAMTPEEEDEEFYRPQKSNSRKSLLPLFVYLIITQYSSPKKPMQQQQILDLLQSKYELIVERKAVSRTIHSLVDEYLQIKYDKRLGVWYNEYD